MISQPGLIAAVAAVIIVLLGIIIVLVVIMILVKIRYYKIMANSIVITVTMHYSHRQEYRLQLKLYPDSVIGTPAIA